jgi:hypothetical protein
MKTRLSVKFLITALLSLWLVTGCADQQTKQATAAPATKASPEATAAIASAGAAIKAAKSNDWIWRDTEQFLTQAQTAADKGDNAAAIKLANKAKDQAELAVSQYKHEKTHPRGL